MNGPGNFSIDTMNRGRGTRLRALGVVVLAWAALPWVPSPGQVIAHSERAGPTIPHLQREAGASNTSAVPLGFSPRSFTTEQSWEERYLKIPDAARCGKYLRRITAEPHVAGTAGDQRVTQFIFDEFERDGLGPEGVEDNMVFLYPQ